MSKIKNRFWEIDFLRGIGISLMIIFHLLYDLNFFGIYKLNLFSGYFLILAYAIASIFIVLVGISLTLSYNRVKKSLTQKQILLKYLKRGLTIFSLGLLITLATWIYLEEGFVVFGVLHCIGISIIFAYPFLQFRYKNLIFGIFLILVGVVLKTITFDIYWLVWLGFIPSQFTTVDYFPLIPWFGVVLIGIVIGNTLYPNLKRKFKIKDRSDLVLVKIFCFLGRHSLIIYFLHQPLFIGIIGLASL